VIRFSQKGDFEGLNSFFEKSKNIIRIGQLDIIAQRGVEALKKATPIDTGKTASSWDYKIERTKNTVSISFYNSNVNDGIPIAILIQYGHATQNGSWVEGRDFINPTLRPIFDEISDRAWEEVKKL
jgi:hypothetical protein